MTHGIKLDLPTAVADVNNKVLMAVTQMVDAGNAVHFEKNSNHILNYGTGIRTEMEEVNGQYTFDMWVPNLGNANTAQSKKSVNSFNDLVEEDDEEDDEDEEVNTEPTFRRQA